MLIVTSMGSPYLRKRQALANPFILEKLEKLASDVTRISQLVAQQQQQSFSFPDMEECEEHRGDDPKDREDHEESRDSDMTNASSEEHKALDLLYRAGVSQILPSFNLDASAAPSSASAARTVLPPNLPPVTPLSAVSVLPRCNIRRHPSLSSCLNARDMACICVIMLYAQTHMAKAHIQRAKQHEKGGDLMLAFTEYSQGNQR